MKNEKAVKQIKSVIKTLRDWEGNWYENVLDPEQENEPSPYTKMIRKLKKVVRELDNYSFRELSPEAQERAVRDYAKGLKETRPNEPVTLSEAMRLCDEDEMRYDKNGKYKYIGGEK